MVLLHFVRQIKGKKTIPQTKCRHGYTTPLLNVLTLVVEARKPQQTSNNTDFFIFVIQETTTAV